MKAFRFVALLALLLPAGFAMEKPSGHTAGSPTGTPSGPLKPGEYWWHPEVSPSGPVVALVSIPQQVMHVYRNGILIGRTTVSTGAKGHGTPAGVFTILEKKRSHHSKKYNNAPMPNMQRLTWSGIAMHSGNLPGYPASHGCIRMPYDFSARFFEVTAKGGTVVIGDGKTPQPRLAANPGVLLAPADFRPEMAGPLPAGGFEWRPERSPSGPVTVLISAADRALYVYRNGNPIGRASLQIRGSGPLGGHVFALLDGVTEKPSWWAPGRPARRWMRVTTDALGRKIDPDALARRFAFHPEFAANLYDALAPGATVIVTDQGAVRNASRDFTILTN
jgi:hypothetical protein